MGRRLPIVATINDLQTLIQEVEKEYPTLCVLELNYKARTIIPLPPEQLEKHFTYYLTTIETYHQIMRTEKEVQQLYPEENNWDPCAFMSQSVEISVSLVSENHSISGVINPNNRIFVTGERTKIIDSLYNCFIKHTKKIAFKYKEKSYKGGLVYYVFPEADAIIKDYLRKTERGEPHNYNIVTPEDFPEQYILDSLGSP